MRAFCYVAAAVAVTVSVCFCFLRLVVYEMRLGPRTTSRSVVTVSYGCVARRFTACAHLYSRQSRNRRGKEMNAVNVAPSHGRVESADVAEPPGSAWLVGKCRRHFATIMWQ